MAQFFTKNFHPVSESVQRVLGKTCQLESSKHKFCHLLFFWFLLSQFQSESWHCGLLAVAVSGVLVLCLWKGKNRSLNSGLEGDKEIKSEDRTIKWKRWERGGGNKGGSPLYIPRRLKNYSVNELVLIAPLTSVQNRSAKALKTLKWHKHIYHTAQQPWFVIMHLLYAADPHIYMCMDYDNWYRSSSALQHVGFEMKQYLCKNSAIFPCSSFNIKQCVHELKLTPSDFAVHKYSMIKSDGSATRQ